MTGFLSREWRCVLFASVLVAAVLLAATGAVAAQSAPDCSAVSYNGDGTEANPYEVSNVEQLQCMGDEETETELDDNFVQVTDIEASETSRWNPEDEFTENSLTVPPVLAEGDQFELTYSPVDELLDTGGVDVNLVDPEEGIVELQENIDGTFDVTYRTVEEIPQGFEPIGTFTGTFNGGEHAIQSLVIDRGTERGVGMFSNIEGVAEEVVLDDVDITGSTRVGGLTGINLGGEIKGSYVMGDVTGDGDVGGLVGGHFRGEIRESYAEGSVRTDFQGGGLVGSGGSLGEIKRSYATADVTGEGDVGGLIGTSPGKIEESYAEGDVTGSVNVGGLLGNNVAGTEIKESYAMGDVTGDRKVGGIVGVNRDSGEIDNSYARGDVTGDRLVGGIVGGNAGELDKSYATGKVSGNEDVGGLVGHNGGDARTFGGGSEGVVRDSYWDTQKTTQQEVIGTEGRDDENGNEGENLNVEGEVEGLTTGEMQGSTAETNMRIFDFENTWKTVTNPDDYPVLSWQVLPPVASFGLSTDTPTVNEAVTFDASASSDSDGMVQTYAWDFDGDGTTDATRTVPLVTHTYNNPGTYAVTLEVTDDDGATDTTTRTVSVSSGGNLSPDNPFGDSSGNPVSRQTVIDRIVQWNTNGEIDGTSHTRQEIIGFVVQWNTAT
ncbi:MAG: PKD domain-containing protein [Halobacteriales archaeon]|nr:PKD domain-containing protein [Halobacteriales archaeon]